MFAAKNELFTRPSGGFVIPRSLRFRASASAYLNRAQTTGNTQKSTWSGWVKRGTLTTGAYSTLFNAGTANTDSIVWNSTGDTLRIWLSGAADADLITTQQFRDPSAYYHIVVAIDTTQATAANRILLYVNGVQVTAFTTATYPTQNYTFTKYNTSGQTANLGGIGATLFFDGYMAEVNWIDGQQLTPTSFGATSATTGVWAPIKYTGTYGTNGFHLDFNSYATTAALGTDTSGNSNTWTVNNVSVTAGATYDSMVDVPTVGTTGSNYSTLNPLHMGTGSSLSSGNLNFASTSSGGSVQQAQITGSFGLPQSGKWYFECTPTTLGASIYIGVVASTHPMATSPFSGSPIRAYESTGDKSTGGTDSAYGSTYTTNDVIGVAVDMGAGEIVFYKNNTAQNSGTPAFTDLAGTTWLPYTIPGSSGVTNNGNFNFGQRAFTYTPPSGYSALNTYNLPTPTILKGNTVMDATLYTGTGASLSVTNAAGFQPDLVWVKGRSGATDHAWYDSVRGVQKQLESNQTGAETTETTGLTAFGSGGFTVGALAQMNTSAATYVGWQWKGSGTTVSNTSGTITSTVCVNPTAGFSVLTYTGTGINATLGHGLGVAPQLIITKGRDLVGGATNWTVYHVSIGNTGAVFLNLTNATNTSITQWNNTSPTSSVFSIGTSGDKNTNTGTYVAYCFAPIAGYSAFGSYVGNSNVNGPFVYLGFRPRYLMIKNSTSTAFPWVITDTARNPTNTGTDENELRANSTQTEAQADADYASTIDILSNGFKLRETNVNSYTNESGSTFVYAAFAESPFKNSLAR